MIDQPTHLVIPIERYKGLLSDYKDNAFMLEFLENVLAKEHGFFAVLYDYKKLLPEKLNLE